ncbi:MAG: biotin--[acetyl-CoA-carboxylase] ligase [Candidatus Methylacidiphilales bacterium]
MNALETQPFAGWTIIDVDQAPSTNDLAARESPWTVVRARRQTAGRGRQNRHWVSSEGGLWLSAVLPAPPSEWVASTAPLVAGLAVVRALGELGVRPVRLRWPNDLMVDERKLGGILAERPGIDRLIIGLGLNVHNDPERDDPTLMGQTISLARLGLGNLGVSDLSTAVLDALQRVFHCWVERGFGALLPDFESLWGTPRQVRIVVDQTTLTGRFLGIDAVGNPRIETDSGSVHVVFGPLVWQLIET